MDIVSLSRSNAIINMGWIMMAFEKVPKCRNAVWRMPFAPSVPAAVIFAFLNSMMDFLPAKTSGTPEPWLNFYRRPPDHREDKVEFPTPRIWLPLCSPSRLRSGTSRPNQRPEAILDRAQNSVINSENLFSGVTPSFGLHFLAGERRKSVLLTVRTNGLRKDISPPIRFCFLSQELPNSLSCLEKKTCLESGLRGPEKRPRYAEESGGHHSRGGKKTEEQFALAILEVENDDTGAWKRGTQIHPKKTLQRRLSVSKRDCIFCIIKEDLKVEDVDLDIL